MKKAKASAKPGLLHQLIVMSGEEQSQALKAHGALKEKPTTMSEDKAFEWLLKKCSNMDLEEIEAFLKETGLDSKLPLFWKCACLNCNPVTSAVQRFDFITSEDRLKIQLDGLEENAIRE